ncbi:MAG TPA: DUF4142 domain-containing protein [Thermoanaerobaculia bacterium]|nr:DUF4142 domain-containing protein [Thermoanaerobaculia bacterium]
MKFRIAAALAIATAVLAGCASTSNQKLTDPQIAMIMRVTNLSAVRESEMAREKAADTAVRDFAVKVVSDRSAQNSKAEAALAEANVFSEDTPRSRALDAASGAAVQKLEPLAGEYFDRAYVDRQVDALQNTLNLVDTTLAPAAKHKVLRRQLSDLHALVEKELTAARALKK